MSNNHEETRRRHLMTQTNTHVYEIMIGSTPEKVWQALTDGELTQKYYFGSRFESDWKAGSSYRAYGQSGDVDSEGEIISIDSPSRLVATFKPLWLSDATASTTDWEITAVGPVTLVKLTHSNIDDASFESAQFHSGWIYVLSSLKSLLETGEGLPDIMAQ
jgi:uncharacterized protein YndB with AHSA1/START domain